MKRLYRFMLHLYPARFRALFADEMSELLDDRLRAARRRDGRRGAAKVWCRTFIDLAVSAGREHLDARERRAHVPRARGGSMLQDLKYAARALVARPGVSAAVVLTLGMGIGANGVIVSIVQTVLYGGFACEEPERIVVIENRYGTSTSSSSPPDYIDRRDQTELLESVAAIRAGGMSLSGVGVPEQVRVARVTASFFDVMRVRGLRSSAAFPHETSANVDKLAVLSEGLKQRLFGEVEPTGELIRLDGEPYRVVAVMPARFDYPKDTDLWIPLHFTPEELANDNRGNEYLSVVGRLAPGVGIEAVRAEMSTIAARVIERVPERAAFLERNAWGAAVAPFTESVVGAFRSQLFLLWAAVSLVLVIVCANIANVLLAVAESRDQELSVKVALGATRGRLTRQLLTESLLVGIAGTVLATGLTAAAVSTLTRWVPHDLPGMELAALDTTTLLWMLATTLLTVAAFGALPAWRGGARVFSSRGTGLRRALVVAEIAVAVVLLVGAGVVLEAFRDLSRSDPGFRTAGRTSFRVTLPRNAYPDRDSRRRFVLELADRLALMPGVEAAAGSYRVPLDGETWTATFYPEGFDFDSSEPAPSADFNVTTPGYVDVVGIPLIDGRDFETLDGPESARVVLIDESTADRFWPRGGAVGARLNFAGPGNPPDLRLIVGVVGHVLNDRLDEPGRMQVYVPAAQSPQRTTTFTLRVSRSDDALASAIRAEVAALDASLPIYDLRPLGAVVEDALALPRFNLRMLAGFAGMALMLSGLGIYSVLSTNVSARTAEIGLRVAIGASRTSVFGLVLKEALALTGAGLVAGGAAAFGLTRWLSTGALPLPEAESTTFALMAVVVIAVTVVAAIVPARRAVLLDPVRALRVER